MADINDVLDKHWSELKALPNVLNVAISTKYKDSKDTGVPSITVYVDKKRLTANLRPEHVVPEVIEGIVTDVIELAPPTWTAGKTSVSEIHPAEQKRRLGAIKGIHPIVRPRAMLTGSAYSQKSDLTKWASPVQNQLNCGSCTAFGATGVAEAMKRIQTNLPNDPLKLSEADAFFCAGGTCDNGSTVEDVLNHMLKVGVCLESCQPYHDHDTACGAGRCANWWESGLWLKSWGYITDKAAMKAALDVKPLVLIMAVHQSFFNYKSGVYQALPSGDPIVGYHCIGCFGHDEALSAWGPVRNSWGVDWGEAGYFRILFGDSEIDGQMYQVEVSTDPLPVPAPGPNPPPQPNRGCLTAPVTWFLALGKKLFKK